MAQSAVPRPHAAFITLSVCSVFPRSIPHQSFSMRTWSHCQFVMMPNINSIGGRYLIGLVNANLTLRFSRFSKASALYANPKRLTHVPVLLTYLDTQSFNWIYTLSETKFHKRGILSSYADLSRQIWTAWTDGTRELRPALQPLRFAPVRR